MTTLDPGDLEVPLWMTLGQAGTILQPRIRNADWRQVLLDAIENREIEMRQATQNGGVVLLPASANLHLKPTDVDWANSQIPVNRILYKPGTYASDAMLPVRIGRADFMDRFKRILNAGEANIVANTAQHPERRSQNKGGAPFKEDWPALQDALKTEIRAVGPPRRDGVPGWRSYADVGRWVAARLENEVCANTLRYHVSRMLAEIQKELEAQ